MRWPLLPTLTVLCGLTPLLLPGATPPAGALTIDDFEASGFVVDDPLGPPATSAEQSLIPSANVRGGVRLVSVASVGPDALIGIGRGEAVLAITPLDDGAVLTTVGSPVATRFTFVYDGIADGVLNARNGNLDLSLLNYDSIDVTISGLGAAVGVTLSLWDSNSLVPLTATLPYAAGTLSFALAGFALDLGDIQSIRLELTNVQLLDALTLSHIEAVVPEPASAALLALGLTGLAAQRGRRVRPARPDPARSGPALRVRG